MNETQMVGLMLQLVPRFVGVDRKAHVLETGAVERLNFE